MLPSKQSPAEEERDVTATEAIESALGQLRRLTQVEPVGATGVRPTDEGWQVEIEVVEERHVPSTSDLMALYEVDLDLDGELLSYRRSRRYVRGNTAGNGGAR